MSLEIVPVQPGASFRVLKISGRLDASSTEEHQARIMPLTSQPPYLFVGDLGALKYISSSGLNLLIGLCRKLREHGGDLILVGAQDHVREIFDLTGHSKIFHLYDSVEKATESLRA